MDAQLSHIYVEAGLVHRAWTQLTEDRSFRVTNTGAELGTVPRAPLFIPIGFVSQDITCGDCELHVSLCFVEEGWGAGFSPFYTHQSLQYEQKPFVSLEETTI